MEIDPWAWDALAGGDAERGYRACGAAAAKTEDAGGLDHHAGESAPAAGAEGVSGRLPVVEVIAVDEWHDCWAVARVQVNWPFADNCAEG